MFTSTSITDHSFNISHMDYVTMPIKEKKKEEERGDKGGRGLEKRRDEVNATSDVTIQKADLDLKLSL